MPTYDYECRECAHTFDVLQSMSAPKLTTCPECGKESLARLMGSGSGVIFKGSGFYETDYKKKEPPKSEKPAPSACKSCPAAEGGACPSAS
ncbi:MAG: zinc ribbon domain-containing protein [Candidatus Omnitrophota bacterium]